MVGVGHGGFSVILYAILFYRITEYSVSGDGQRIK